MKKQLRGHAPWGRRPFSGLPACRQGFTLTELLAVIAIMGILATIVMVSLISSRARGRDAQRLAAVQQLRAAIDQYAVDHGHFPNTGGPGHWAMFDPTAYAPFVNQGIDGTSNTIIQALSPYIDASKFVDPSGRANGTDAGYQYVSDGKDYALFSWRRPENMCKVDPANIDSGVNRCPTITNCKCVAPGDNYIGVWTKNAAGW